MWCSLQVSVQQGASVLTGVVPISALSQQMHSVNVFICTYQNSKLVFLKNYKHCLEVKGSDKVRTKAPCIVLICT